MRLIIQGSMDDSIKSNVEGIETAKEMWETLQQTYAASGLNHANALCDDLTSVELSDFNNDTYKYCAKFKEINNQLIQTGCGLLPVVFN